MKEKNKIMVVDMISALFILLFIYGAASKLLDYQKFQVQLGKSVLLAGFTNLMAFLVPGIEIVIACLLMIKRFQIVALYAAYTLMATFTIYILVVLNYSENIPCSCGGILERMTWSQHLWFNIFFVILAGLAVLLYPTKHKEIIAQ